MIQETSYAALEHLLNAKSKKFIDLLFIKIFQMRSEVNRFDSGDVFLNAVASELEITISQVQEVISFKFGFLLTILACESHSKDNTRGFIPRFRRPESH